MPSLKNSHYKSLIDYLTCFKKFWAPNKFESHLKLKGTYILAT